MTKIHMLSDKPPSTPCGGFIVLRRDKGARRLKAANRPYEHTTLAAARAEAKALAARHGVEFVVFKELAPIAASKKTGA